MLLPLKKESSMHQTSPVFELTFSLDFLKANTVKNSVQIEQMKKIYNGMFKAIGQREQLNWPNVFQLVRARYEMDMARLHQRSVLFEQVKAINQQSAKELIAADHDKRLSDKLDQIEGGLVEAAEKSATAFLNLQKRLQVNLIYKEKRDASIELLYIDTLSDLKTW